MKGPSPLLGYNTNVRHKGKLFHIQTEDSGIKHPHVITHLFADGGRIIASRKTGYAEHVGAENYQEIVKQLMREQHKAVFIALRDGEYDEGEDAAPSTTSPGETSVEVDVTVDVDTGSVPAVAPAAQDMDALDRAAAALEERGSSTHRRPPVSSPGLYSSTRPAVEVAGRRPESRPPESIFGSDLLSEKSLDEVILSYLAEDLETGDDKG